MRRRSFLNGLIASAALSVFSLRRARGQAWSGYTFRHGVASGDPLDDGVILWTRVSGANSGALKVTWEVARDPDMLRIVQRGDAWTDDDRDYTVKADVRGLRPGAVYYYRFEVYGAVSEVGRTRTLPEGHVEQARFAVVSCSNHPYGFFHAYREIANRDDLDGVVHLGDYIYEYGLGGYGTEYAEALDRAPEPPTELLTLHDYRLRHAQYKADVDSRAMHARHPLIAVWDDHEIANDAFWHGAENHEEQDGDFEARARAAVRAYFEWMPIRGRADGADTRIFRTFEYGDLLSLVMLDTRLYGRDRQPDVPVGDEQLDLETIMGRRSDADKQMLGQRQQQWLRGKLQGSRSTWQVIGQQVLLAPVYSPDLEPLLDPEGEYAISEEQLMASIAMSKSNPPLLLDTWNGYPAAREALLADLQDHARNPVVLTGDLHTSMCNEVIADGDDKPVTVEFMVTSVTSPGFAEYLPERRPNAISDAAIELNPWVKYMETNRRGWMCFTIDHEQCEAEWHLLDTVHKTGYTSTVDRQHAVRAGQIEKGVT